MSSKPILHYFNGRGKAEIIRLTMAAAGIEWTPNHMTEVEHFQNLKNDKKLLFGQLPLLEIDGKNLVQSSATARYVARKGGLLGDNEDEMVRIDVLYEGTRDFQSGYGSYGFNGYDEVKENVRKTHLKRYLPIFEQVLKDNGSNGHLVGNKLTFADVGLLEPILWTEELLNEELAAYPEIQKFSKTVKSHPSMQAYLNGPLRPRINDAQYVAEVGKVLQW